MGNGAVQGTQIKSTSEQKRRDALVEMLSEVPLFNRLPKAKRLILAKNLEFEDFSEGSAIIKQGDVGNDMFIILLGQCSVWVQGVDSQQPPELVHTLERGAFFGETALLKDVLRTRTIKAVGGPVQTARISRDKFQKLKMRDLIVSYKRREVGLGRGSIIAKEPTPKTPEEHAQMSDALYKNAFLQKVLELSENQVNSLIHRAWSEEVSAGTKIINRGDPTADYFYIVRTGSFSLEKNANDSKLGVNVDKGASGVTFGILGPGCCFGELALLCVMPRSATISALENSSLWVVDRQSFRNILLEGSAGKIEKRLQVLKKVYKVGTLASLKEPDLRTIAEAMTEVYFEEGEQVMTQGWLGVTMMYILIEGKVDVIKDGKVLVSLEYNSEIVDGTPPYFGELSLVNDRPRAATVVVVSSFARCLALDQSTVDLVVGCVETTGRFLCPSALGNGTTMWLSETSMVPWESANRRSSKNSEWLSTPRNPSQNQCYLSERLLPDLTVRSESKRVLVHDRILLDDLEKLGTLGCGAFGYVELCQHRKTKVSYALKVLSKGYVVQSNMQKQVWVERDVLLTARSPFIIYLYEAYSDAQNLFFLLELASAGDLMQVYDQNGLHGSEKHAKFYSAGVLFALAHLHKYRIMHRDLKTENVLLNAAGYIKLTDMGLAKQCLGEAFTACGTPEYFAPEILASTGYTLAADWWMFGIFLHELMLGYTPFEAADVCETFTLIKNGITGRLPTSLKKPLKDLLKALLMSEPSQRLPMRDGGINNVQKQKWFEGFNWEECLSQKLPAPYQPAKREGKDVLENFGAGCIQKPIHVQYSDDGSGWDSNFAT